MNKPEKHFNYQLQDVLKESGYFDDLPSQVDISPYLTPAELKQLGFRHVGKNVKVSRKCSFYVIDGVIFDDVRIDDFCILKGAIDIGSNVHICAYSMLSGVGGRIELCDFSVLAARCSVYTASNDHAADALPAPLSPPEFTKQKFGDVSIGSGVLVGAHTVILPGVKLGHGSSVGAGCVVSNSLAEGEMLRSAKPSVSKHKRNTAWIRTLILRFLENKAGEV